MTRKDYVLIADALGFAIGTAEKHGFNTDSIHYSAGVISANLKGENPRFDSEKFFTAIDKKAKLYTKEVA